MAMWKTVQASVMGSSHHRQGTPCQDSHRVSELSINGRSCLIVVCSDGAGSASHSHIGSDIACERFMTIASQAFVDQQIRHDLARSQVMEWLDLIRSDIDRQASSLGLSVRDLACTLLAVVVTDKCSVFLQVGDGAIVTLDDYTCEAIFWPQSGEFANTTNFLTDSSVGEVAAFRVTSDRPKSFAVFTDGLERLILRFVDHSVHRPFLTPFFERMRITECCDALVDPLRRFLDSDGVNERTDDDKTLILAMCMSETNDVPLGD